MLRSDCGLDPAFFFIVQNTFQLSAPGKSDRLCLLIICSAKSSGLIIHDQGEIRKTELVFGKKISTLLEYH